MSFRLSQGFSFLDGSFSNDAKKVEASREHERPPSLKLHTDKEIYRPGDLITVTIEISTPEIFRPHIKGCDDVVSPFLVDNVTFEIKGIEKFDIQWFAMQKPPPVSKLKRGEHLFLDCRMESLVSKVIISSGCSKTYLVRAELPNILPPSYRGTTIRYIYYVKSTLAGRWLVLENGPNRGSTTNTIQVEARIPLNIWVTQKGNILPILYGQDDDILPAPTIQIDACWREKDAESEWVRANDVSDGFEEGYDSSRDEISSVSSYNPSKVIDVGFRNLLSFQSVASRHSINEARYSHGEPSSLPSYPTLSQLSVAEVTDEPSGALLSPRKRLSSYSSTVISPSHQSALSNSPSASDNTGGHSATGSVEPVASEGFIRGRSYNIRIDDQVLLRFSPKNSDSTYYFGDMIGGTLTVFHKEGARRCLEVSVTLEISETINQKFIHPSRRNSPIITKVQCDYHEVVADLVQTSFLFSIPMDGPMSFSTPYISVKWALRFEFFTTPENVDLTRYEHPLLIEGREKGEWVLPITVSAPPPRTQAVQSKSERPFSLGNLSVQT